MCADAAPAGLVAWQVQQSQRYTSPNYLLAEMASAGNHGHMTWHKIYDLRADADWVAKVQKATLTTKDYGIEPTHGIFGSDEWWLQIADGRLPMHTLKGTITRVYMGSMGDWPEFEMKCDDGALLKFTRKQTLRDGTRDGFYTVGSKIEIDAVWQDSRHDAPDWGLPRTKRTVIAIRIAT